METIRVLPKDIVVGTLRIFPDAHPRGYDIHDVKIWSLGCEGYADLLGEKVPVCRSAGAPRSPWYLLYRFEHDFDERIYQDTQ